MALINFSHKGIIAGVCTAISLTIGAFCAEKNPETATVISVDSATPLGPVNRKVLGHNMEAADGRGIFSEPADAKTFNLGGIRDGQGYWNAKAGEFYPEVVKMTKDLGGGMLRYPGGCLAHNFDWRKAVGPRAQRGDWQFGIPEYLMLCEQLGAEPIITVSDYVLPAEEMPAHAAQLVEYLNSPATPEHPMAMQRKADGHPEPYGVKWFELGNESSHGNHHCTVGRTYTPAQYVEYAVNCAKAMRAVDPTIKLGVVTVPGPGNDFDSFWNKTIYKGACPVADFLVVHFYGPRVRGNKFSDNFKSCMAYTEQLAGYMASYRALVKEGCGKDLPLAVTEYNIGNSIDKPVQYRFTFTAGMLCSDMMRLFLQPESKVTNAEYWQVLSGWWGMYRSKDGEITKKQAPLAFYQLWGQHFGGNLLASAVKNSPQYDAPAAGGMNTARGKESTERNMAKEIQISEYDFTTLKNEGIEVVSSAPGSFTLKFSNFTKEAYIDIAKFDNVVNGSGLYRLLFDAKFTPEGKSDKPIGLSLLDTRGWEATQSAMAVEQVNQATEWTELAGDLITLADCPGLFLVVRTPAPQGAANGVLEVKNLRIEAWDPGASPGYQGITTASSISEDGKTLHLLVFNKSMEQDITCAVELGDFKASAAKSYTVVQDKVESTEYIAPVEAEVALPAAGEKLKIKFPAHSMTAIDFTR